MNSNFFEVITSFKGSIAGKGVGDFKASNVDTISVVWVPSVKLKTSVVLTASVTFGASVVLEVSVVLGASVTFEASVVIGLASYFNVVRVDKKVKAVVVESFPPSTSVESADGSVGLTTAFPTLNVIPSVPLKLHLQLN